MLLFLGFEVGVGLGVSSPLDANDDDDHGNDVDLVFDDPHTNYPKP